MAVKQLPKISDLPEPPDRLVGDQERFDVLTFNSLKAQKKMVNDDLNKTLIPALNEFAVDVNASVDAAALSERNAHDSEEVAKRKAGEASGSAGAAKVSEDNAKVSETNALASKNAAALSAESAESARIAAEAAPRRGAGSRQCRVCVGKPRGAGEGRRKDHAGRRGRVITREGRGDWWGSRGSGERAVINGKVYKGIGLGGL